ncbi:erythroid differentiation-related factor 1-like isoform X2 [Anneissia japonica]|uniref:erythroid differentiation-related factor 1-like isoform X1 n=1 Tax=Anneissia japonica TaxID=1529436 RepID=UPI0014256C6C|nr:erythroid differentiation-related factor 1-like isoform X1 [Anneissia japonica]XP_033119487.1 erythroid differentiation-related factor 1-like isoform X1 [Anneissia japonica]XP_033119488.1 erythroid differentiation-related factor 1-like isoform X2 [Anneissia japonica]
MEGFSKTKGTEKPVLTLSVHCPLNDGREDQKVDEEKQPYGPVQDNTPKTMAVANFSQIEVDTNLREAPDNWLRGKKYFKVPRNWLNSESAKFSSLLMAESYLETVTEVNVITAAENIKKLLKMPFSKAQISMAVHRIDKTLLLDELDLYKHFGTSQSNDLDWFYSFIRGILLQDGKNFKRRKKHKENSQKWNLLSKFLYHSIGQCDQDALELEQVPEASSPEPTVCDFARQVLWKFEDISMLLGTDLPIFGGGTFPAVSLRLRDTNSPINVLTGMDYWLDNLMCNVPELAMCYHLDGFVQKYEVIKTEEIPHISQAQFSPKVVKDVAQNILSFIKSNCTQEGHTYWLFKGNNDDVIKLYDLSSLYEDSTQRGKNPFVMPVALLLYKVARNMSISDPSKRNVICKLLTNCIELLEETGQDNTEIMAAATFLLGHTLLTKVHSTDDDTDEEILTEMLHTEVSEAIKPTLEFDVRRLMNPGEMVDNTVDSKATTKELKSPHELAKVTVDCVVKGLRCIENCESSNVCTSSQPIPLKYKTSTKNSRTRNDSLTRSTSPGMRLPVESWQQKYKLDLLQDGFNSFLILAKHEIQMRSYGIALRYVRVALSCFESVFDYVYACKIGDCNKRISEILEICGDAHLLMVDDVKHHQQQFNEISENESKILEHVTVDSEMEDLSWAVQFQSVRQDCLETANHCYESILDHYGEGHDPDVLITITRKLGSTRNELGIWFMNLAIKKRQKAFTLEEEQNLWSESYKCFEKALKAFKAVEDVANIALLYNNMGRLMRTCAQAIMGKWDEGRSREFSDDERHYFNKAVDYYQKGKSILKNRTVHPGIWDAITWELSTTYFTMATALQDNAPLSKLTREEVEKEVLHLMHQVLSLSESSEPTSSHAILHQFRTANVYHRLGSMYHSSLRNQVSDKKKRYTRSLANHNYEKAEKLFRVLERPTELLRVLLERMAMIEHQFHSQTGNSTKIKSLQCCLEMLLQCKGAIEMLQQEQSTSQPPQQASCSETVEPVKNHGEQPTSEIPDNLAIEKCKQNYSLPVVREEGFPLESTDQSERKFQGSTLEDPKPIQAAELDSTTEVEQTEVEQKLESSKNKQSLVLACQQVVNSKASVCEAVDSTTSVSIDIENKSNERGGKQNTPSNTCTTESNSKSCDSLGIDEDAEVKRLEGILKARLQYVLLNLVKIHSTMKRNKDNEKACTEYKKMYATSLKIGSSEKYTLLLSLTEINVLNEKLQTGELG